MNIEQAYKIFELKPNNSLDEVKKKHKDLVKKFHPDINKSEEAPQKMKEINEAFDLIKKHKDGKINNFSTRPEEIIINKEITFAEACYGTKVNVKYNRQVQCSHCEGLGFTQKNNCKDCNGLGTTQKIEKTKFGQTVTRTTCKTCRGILNKQDCLNCYSSGSLSEEVDINVNIPPGVKPNSKLVLREMGNFTISQSFFGLSAEYENAYIIVDYKDNPNFKMVDSNIETNINISFLESISKFERTIILPDDKEINVQSSNQIKHGYKFVIPNQGIGRKGNLIVNTNVENIPEDKLSKILEILQC